MLMRVRRPNVANFSERSCLAPHSDKSFIGFQPFTVKCFRSPGSTPGVNPLMGTDETQIKTSRSWENSCLYYLCENRWLKLFGRFKTEFQDFAGLAVESFADGFERGEADGFGLAGLEDGQVLRRAVHGGGEVVKSHFALCENHVEIDDDGHNIKRSTPVPPESSGLRP
jgi:hypothetical protein